MDGVDRPLDLAHRGACGSNRLLSGCGPIRLPAIRSMTVLTARAEHA